jgi:hypothetical protein
MIEKRIHQVWLGEKIPALIQERMNGVRACNSDFAYRLHTDVKPFESDPYVKWLIATGAKTAFLVDRIRLLVLKQEGGVYVDCDCFACKPFNTMDLFSDPKVDFMFGMRSPDRAGVGLHGPISFVDNTVMGSAKNGRVVNRLMDLYAPNGKLQNGGSVGLHILRHCDTDCRVVNFRAFYADRRYPESILLHDAINLGSWAK